MDFTAINLNLNVPLPLGVRFPNPADMAECLRSDQSLRATDHNNFIALHRVCVNRNVSNGLHNWYLRSPTTLDVAGRSG